MRRAGEIADAIAIAAALVIKFASPSAAWVEANYSNGAYPAIDRAVRAVTGPLPFCLGDVLFVGALLWLAVYWIASLRRAAARPWPRLARILVRTTATAAAIFVWFIGSWAYNYSRIPLSAKIIVHHERTDAETVNAFADHVTDELSKYAEAAHAEHFDDAALGVHLGPRFEALIHRLGDVASFSPPAVKPTIFQPFLQLSGSTGFTDPWTHEVNIDATVFDVERAAIYAHEWAHVAGFADESEANYISAIACTTSASPLLKYSGWLLVWFNLPADVHLTHRLGRIAYKDILAIQARYRRNVNEHVERAQRAAYDAYLKTNRVKAGYASYHLFIRWMTGADYDHQALPVVKPRPL